LDNEILSKKLWKLELSEYIVLSMVIIYSAVFSYYTIMMHYSFRSYAWDLGILVQSITSATKGMLFNNNVELYFSPSGSYFGVHFSPIYFMIIPFFYLVPKVETFFIIQSLVLSLSVIPVYLLTKHHLNDRLVALLFSVAYLLNPLLQSINWYYFPPQTFLPLLFLSATYFLKKRSMPLFLFFILLALMTTEQTSYLIALYIIYIAWEVRTELRSMFYLKKPSVSSLIPFITFAITIAWAIFARNVIYTLNPNPSPELKAVGNYSILDIKDVNEIPFKAIANPDLVFKAVHYEFPLKLLYIILTFAPSGFFALLSPVAILPALSWLFLSILSNHAPYYQLGFHYPALTLPFIIVATIEAIRKIPGHFDARSIRKVYRNLSIMLLLLGLILSVFTSPLSPIQKSRSFDLFRDYGITYPSLADETVKKTLNLIPKDALVLTTPTIFPHIATNINAYTIPPKNAPSPRLYTGQLRYLQSINYDYIFLAYLWDKNEADVIYNKFIRNEDSYGLFIKGPGIELYKRGYVGSAENLAIKFSYQELFATVYSKIIDDSSSESGKVIMLESSPKEGNGVWFGPYITLLPGEYVANFKIKVDRLVNGKIIKLDIWSNSLKLELNSLEIYGGYFVKPLTWHIISVPFKINERTTDVEFRGIEASSDISIWLDYVEVVPK